MRRHKSLLIPAIFSLMGAGALSGFAQNSTPTTFAGAPDQMNKPFPPHKVIGNVYYVGSEGLCTVLITTPEGHFLINSNFEANVPIIRAGVEKLGFKLTDIKIILGSHAHTDHMQADAMLKELTGARVMAMEQDVPALRAMTPGGKPHPIDRVLHDGDTVTLGGTTLTAVLTAGHTKGNTTWTLKAEEDGKTYNVVILGGMGGVNALTLVNNKDYPQIADDFMRSFKVLRDLPCDVFLASHSSFYGLTEKYAKMQKGGPNLFIDPVGYKMHLDLQEKAFLAKLEEQRKAAAK
jgi:metallo-beta-lactamase class B